MKKKINGVVESMHAGKNWIEITILLDSNEFIQRIPGVGKKVKIEYE